jgi:hypothetical protein
VPEYVLRKYCAVVETYESIEENPERVKAIRLDLSKQIVHYIWSSTASLASIMPYMLGAADGRE